MSENIEEVKAPTVEVDQREAQAILQICELALKAPNALAITSAIVHLQNKFNVLFQEK